MRRKVSWLGEETAVGHSHSFMIDLAKGRPSTLFFCLTAIGKLPIV